MSSIVSLNNNSFLRAQNPSYNSVANYNPSSIPQQQFNTTNLQNTKSTSIGTDAVYTSWNNPTSSDSATEDVDLTLIHFNDNHRKVRQLTQAKTGIMQVEQKAQANGMDLLKIHSGDYNMADEAPKLRLQIELLNDLGVNFAVLGNHEFDIGPEELAKQLKNARYTTLAANLTIPKGSPLDQLKQAGKIMDSAICRVNGHEYGLVGISPPELTTKLDKTKVDMGGIELLDATQTINKVQNEVDKLRQKGINKIILVSHVGHKLDKDIAKNVDGVDIILGGHSHDLLDPLEPGLTLFKSKSGEPVLIFQEGRDANFFGVTDFKFNKSGIVQSALARQEDIEDFQPEPNITSIENLVLGPATTLGYATETTSNIGTRYSENAIADLFADCMRTTTGAEIALFLGSRVRDTLKEGKITDRTIESILPYNDQVHVTKLSGKDIYLGLKDGAKSLIDTNVHGGILQVSGMKYAIDQQGNPFNIQIQQSNGQFVPLEMDKTYTVAADNYVLNGSKEGFDSFKKPENILRTYEDTHSIIKYALTNLYQHPLTLKTDNRITVYAPDPSEKDLKSKPKALQSSAQGQQSQTNTPIQYYTQAYAPMYQYPSVQMIPVSYSNQYYMQPAGMYQYRSGVKTGFY